MTLIQPHQQKNIYFALTMALFLMLFTGVVWLIFLYNQSVNFRHGAANAKSEIQKLQLQSSVDRDTVFAYFQGDNAQIFASSHGLLNEKNPRYLRASNDTQWVFASRF